MQDLEKVTVTSSPFVVMDIGSLKLSEIMCSSFQDSWFVLTETNIIITLPLSSQSTALCHCPTNNHTLLLWRFPNQNHIVGTYEIVKWGQQWKFKE